MHKVMFVIPAFQAGNTIEKVIRELQEALPSQLRQTPILVVDDGSTDDTGKIAAEAGARVIRHHSNQGKGKALLSGFFEANLLGATHAVTLDADGQHFAADAVRLAMHQGAPNALILGVRNMAQAGAPLANQRANRFSNFVIGSFSGNKKFLDTQCGLRSYPLAELPALHLKESRFGFESEVIMRFSQQNLPIEEVPVGVFYPPETERQTHYRNVPDTTRIVLRVVTTLLTHPKLSSRMKRNFFS